jgi:hypothetical protein
MPTDGIKLAFEQRRSMEQALIELRERYKRAPTKTLARMVALYALWYNFVRIHKTLRVTPAMAAGIESRLWSMEDVVALIAMPARQRSAARHW